MLNASPPPPPQFTIFSLPPSLNPLSISKGNGHIHHAQLARSRLRDDDDEGSEREWRANKRGRANKTRWEREGGYYHCLPLKSGCVHVPQVRLQVDPLLLARQCKKQAFLSEQCTQGVVLFYLSSRPPLFWGGINVTAISQKTAVVALLLTTQ